MTQDSMIGGRDGREVTYRAIWHILDKMNMLRHAQCYAEFRNLGDANDLLLRALHAPEGCAQ